MSMFSQDVTIVVGDPLLQGKSIPELATVSIMKYADTLVTAVYRVLHSGYNDLILTINYTRKWLKISLDTIET